MPTIATLCALGLIVIVDPMPDGVRLCLSRAGGVIVGRDGIPTRRVYVGGATVEEAVTRALAWLGIDVGYAVEQAERHTGGE